MMTCGFFAKETMNEMGRIKHFQVNKMILYQRKGKGYRCESGLECHL